MILKVIALFFSFFLLTFSKVTSLSDIKTMNFIVKEEVKNNSDIKTKIYKVKYILPNQLKKEIIYPEMNKGELYIYTDGKKITYLPFFDETTVESGDAEGDYIVNVVSKIREKERTDAAFKEKYHKGEISSMQFDKNLRTKFNKFEKVDGYMIPVEIEIYDGQQMIAKISLSNISLNGVVKQEEFKIKK